MKNEEIIVKFYSAFVKGDYQQMADCYHNEITFQDPAFGQLTGDKPSKMWEMLLSNKDAAPKISFSNVSANGNKGKADWVAEYVYGPKKRKVINQIHAEFTFKDGKIIEHVDHFNVWKWASQALGFVGLVLGWTPFMKNKIQTLANKSLSKFMNNK